MANPLQRLAGYGKPYRRKLGRAIVAMAAYGAANGLLVYLFRPVLNDVFAAAGAPDQGQLRFLLGLILGCTVLKGIGAYFSVYLMADVGQSIVRDLRNELFGHVIGQSASFFSRRNVGALTSRLMNDIGQIQFIITESLGDALRASITVVVLAGVLFYLNPRLALVCIICAPLVVYPLVRLGQRVRRNSRQVQEETARLQHISVEAFSGHRIVAAFAAASFEARRFGQAAERLYRRAMKVTSTLAVLPPLMEWLGALAVVGALLYGVTEVARGDVQAGDFIAFLIALLMMYGPVKKLSRVNAQFHQGMACAERVFEVLDTRSEIADSPSAVPLARPCRDIVFDRVSFTYRDAPASPVLRDVSFRVAAGQVAAIVGLSGAGKTTLVNLLPRLYDVGAGAVRIDGVDVRDVSLASLRAHIGIVTQDTVLFDDTIARNIAYAAQEAHATGSPDAASPDAGTGHAGQADVAARIEAAARAAHAHEFVQELPDGYETRIGDRGLRLSGGQRQRLAIARALFRNAPILILDEATSSLDTESERLVQDALARLLLNRTSFVIAHRLSTVRRADLIVVLDEGEVREIGRHEELLATPGSLYARLYSLQLFDAGRRETPAGADAPAPLGSDA